MMLFEQTQRSGRKVRFGQGGGKVTASGDPGIRTTPQFYFGVDGLLPFLADVKESWI